MNILVTNDDGIYAEGLWALVRELTKMAQVMVVAPDRERSAIGTAVTLRQPLKAERVTPIVPEVEAYSVAGTPGDSVILALGKLIKYKIDLVISGINHGLNLGEDVLISGTVGAALQGYLRNFPAIAISIETMDSRHADNAAKFARLLAKKIGSDALPQNIFLNVNLPSLPLTEIKGVEITRLSSGDHTVTIEEINEGGQKYYRLIRQKIDKATDKRTDMWALEQGNISITPLHDNIFCSPSSIIPDSLGAELFQELKTMV